MNPRTHWEPVRKYASSARNTSDEEDQKQDLEVVILLFDVLLPSSGVNIINTIYSLIHQLQIEQR